MPSAIAKSVQDEAHALYVSGMPPKEICAALSLKENTFFAWVSRKKWVQSKAKRMQGVQGAIVQVVRQGLQAETEALREQMNGEIAAQLNTLSSKPVRYKELFNRGGLQGRAAVLKTVAESFRAVNGSSDQTINVFGVGLLSGSTPQPIDVASEVTPVEQETPQ